MASVEEYLAILEPAWNALCEILEQRRLELIERLVAENDEITRGRIKEIDVTKQILMNLRIQIRQQDQDL